MHKRSDRGEFLLRKRPLGAHDARMTTAAMSTQVANGFWWVQSLGLSLNDDTAGALLTLDGTDLKEERTIHGFESFARRLLLRRGEMLPAAKRRTQVEVVCDFAS